MEKTITGNMVDLIDRRLHPVRLGIGHLNKVIESSRSGSVSVDRDLLFSIISTLEIFVEDFENQYLGNRGSEERKTVDSKLTDSPRVTQTRVG
ncbi:MAG: hypothetical protein KJ645_04400 [Planctomycetes bacterium]|nr:hypothetical protein [Planctomycetota bacterium]